MRINKILSIGWDVGGWMGKKQGFSMCVWDREKHDFEWMGKSLEMGLPEGHLLAPNEIIKFFLEEVNKYDDYQIVIAIDAPLGYPKDFVKFVNGERILNSKPSSEINNVIAYRETERHIFKTFGKKSLSSIFDKIGNNATVAISHIRMWSDNYQFVIQPSDRVGSKEVIEVYPALIKEDGKLKQLFDKAIPNDVQRESDAYDSAICSLMGLKYYVGEELLGVPMAKRPQHIEQYNEEGWIYYINS